MQTEFRSKPDGYVPERFYTETPGDFLPHHENISMHENASMKKLIFEQWKRPFVHKTMALRSELGSILLFLDWNRGHISCSALNNYEKME